METDPLYKNQNQGKFLLSLLFVPSWWEQVLKAGFDLRKPAVVACAGASLYLTKDAITATLKQVPSLAPGSTLAMTFYLPMEWMDEEDRPLQQMAEKGAREAGTPFVSFFAHDFLTSQF